MAKPSKLGKTLKALLDTKDPSAVLADIMSDPELSPGTQLSKTIGALLGVHAGDSLGATLEFKSFESIKAKYPHGLREIVGGGAFSWKPGAATDDTDLTRAVLLAYRDREDHRNSTEEAGDDFDVVNSAADWSLKWYNGDWPGRKIGQTPVDVGGATRTGLLKYERSGDPRKAGAGKGSAGNGSLMRCIPTALFTASQEERIKESMEISAITHDDSRCTVSCAAYNEMVAMLVKGRSAEAAVLAGILTAEELHQAGKAESTDSEDVVKAIRLGTQLSLPDIAKKGPGKTLPDPTSGFVLQTLTVAVMALLDERSLEDILVDVTRIGADTDTNGAIAGGLLGARDGFEAIPERWLKKLMFRDEFEEIATSLLGFGSAESEDGDEEE